MKGGDVYVSTAADDSAAWVLGVFGLMLNLTIIGAVIDIPMVLCGFVLHILGIVFIAMIRVK